MPAARFRARTAPFFGRGTGFPFRADPSTGGVVVTQGVNDSVSVMLEYIAERWTIREDPGPQANHIAEAICHILLTRPTEHDTLPEFGSYIYNILFEPNTREFYRVFSLWARKSTQRWEKRAQIPDADSIAFRFDGYMAQQGRLPMIAAIEFIMEQVGGNLVAPFTDPRSARLQEYQSAEIDDSGHDYDSRYFGIRRVERAGLIFDRLPRIGKIPPAADDQFYEIKPADTWLLASWNLYGDIRFWPYLARMYAEDMAEEGLTRQSLDPSSKPEAGTLLRVPSKTRLLMELSSMRN